VPPLAGALWALLAALLVAIFAASLVWSRGLAGAHRPVHRVTEATT
jgi:hypothetical protein